VVNVNAVTSNLATTGQQPDCILIVDDNQDILDALKDLLTMEGKYFVETASNIQSVKSKLKNFKPDIALLDINLGDSNGLELISVLKNESADIDCIMMTAHHDVDYAVKALRYGAVEYLFKPVDPIHLLKTMAGFLQQQKIKQQEKKKEQNFKQMALHDPLTGLVNRALLYEHLKKIVVHSSRNNQQFSVVFIDLDNFKKINDLHGHHVGDELLVKISKCLKGSVREDDIVARVGGDEFVLVLSSESESVAIQNTVKRLMTSITEMVLIEGYGDTVSISVGIAVYPEGGEDVSMLLRNADGAMYQAKSNGKNCFQFYSSDS